MDSIGAESANGRSAFVDNRAKWEAAFNSSRLRGGPTSTMSGIPLEPVYGPDDGEFPGVYPYTRGNSPSSGPYTGSTGRPDIVSNGVSRVEAFSKSSSQFRRLVMPP